MRNSLFATVLGLTALLLFISQASWSKEPQPKPLVIELKDSSTINFSILKPGFITLSLVPDRNTADSARMIARLSLTGEGCIAGYKGTLNYNKNSSESLFNYFSTEGSWGSTVTLVIYQDKKTNELSITLNGETIKVQTQGRAKFLRAEGIPAPITINSIEHNNN
jgi:hypothetical protein